MSEDACDETPMQRTQRVISLVQPIIEAEREAGRDTTVFAAQMIASLIIGVQNARGTDAALRLLDVSRKGVLKAAKRSEAARRNSLQ